MNDRMPSRIVLTLDRGDVDGRAIQPLLRFAASSNAALEAVLVEDARLQGLMHSPATRFVHAMGHEDRGMAPQSMRLAMVARSRRALQRLAHLHELQALSWLLRETPCQRLVDVFLETSSRDLVVVSLRTDGGNSDEVEQLLDGGWQPLGAATLVINSARPPDTSVLLLSDGGTAELALAASLAQHFRCKLDVVTGLQRRGSANQTGEDESHFNERVHALDIDTNVHALRAVAPEALVARLAALRPGTLLVGKHSPLLRSLNLLELMSVSRGSLYLHTQDT